MPTRSTKWVKGGDPNHGCYPSVVMQFPYDRDLFRLVQRCLNCTPPCLCPYPRPARVKVTPMLDKTTLTTGATGKCLLIAGASYKAGFHTPSRHLACAGQLLSGCSSGGRRARVLEGGWSELEGILEMKRSQNG